MGEIIPLRVNVEIAGPDGQDCLDILAHDIPRKVPLQTMGPKEEWSGVATIANVSRAHPRDYHRGLVRIGCEYPDETGTFRETWVKYAWLAPDGVALAAKISNYPDGGRLNGSLLLTAGSAEELEQLRAAVV